MANYDIKYDTAPANTFGKPRGPKISDLRSALTTFSSTTYTADRLNAMTKNDMIHAVNLHGLTVAGV